MKDANQKLEKKALRETMGLINKAEQGSSITVLMVSKKK